MENEQVQPSYWSSVIIGALFTAIVIFIVSLVSGYMTISSEPTGAMFSPGQFIGILACLIGAFGGVLSTRHYAKTNDITFTIGTGALIGLFTGIIAAVISGVLSQLWQFVDPSFVQNIIDATVANLDAMTSIPDDQKEKIIAGTVETIESQYGSLSGILKGTAISMATFGFLNALTGMIGAKIFASED
tara:strand:+ start:10472 stop:11035 length:564 start_codon:yes stop_codon:yes gene_type:complete